jgi:hypothetical protein
VTGAQLLIHRGDRLQLDLVFPFNASQTPVEFLTLKPPAVPEFTRKLVDAVYRTTSFLYIAEGMNVAVATHVNGYSVQVSDYASQRELFVHTSCIWRLCGALCRASDFLAVREAH